MLTYQKLQDPHSDPSPIASINVFDPVLDSSQEKNVQVIIDTGSGRTFLPESVIENLKLSIYSEIVVKSPLHSSTFKCKLYLVRLELGGISHKVEVIGISKNYGIIGRDILNKDKIVLNAPLTKWGINCSCEEGGCPLSKSE